MENTEVKPPLIWDETLASELPGKLLLVGLNYLDADDNLLEQQQFFGRVHEMVQHSGIMLKLEGLRSGQDYQLPPDMRAISVANPGDYHLRSTGEVVVNPDFTVTFAIRRQADDEVVENA